MSGLFSIDTQLVQYYSGGVRMSGLKTVMNVSVMTRISLSLSHFFYTVIRHVT